MLGQWQLIAQYYQSDEVEGMPTGGTDTGATGITLAAKYFLSKRTGVYASWIQIENDARSWADISGGGMSSAGSGGLGSGSAGADVTMIAVGVMHNF